MDTWRRATLEGIELEYAEVGGGDPVVLVHAGVFADWFEPLLHEPALAARHRLITYHRVGYAGSTHVAGPVSIADQATHLHLLVRQIGIDRAHFVGHSSGANIVMQLALDVPELVHSLALLESALPVPVGSPGRAGIPQAIELYRAGDKAAAVDTFMRAVAGPNYRATGDRVLARSTRAARDGRQESRSLDGVAAAAGHADRLVERCGALRARRRHAHAAP